jgi:hypothetical protein
VFYFEGRVGAGKIASWEVCCSDAIERDRLISSKQPFLHALPAVERMRLDALSNVLRDDSSGEAPGSERGDEEERLFAAALPEKDRRFYEGHKGLGNSQKAEVRSQNVYTDCHCHYTSRTRIVGCNH